ncbi:TfoX/Sxy family protein [Porphyromonadaceae bacterium W3.11]|nr:TfoX/Sxy family protein [Porphyromonadaceae bacterium W3.11]
MACRVEFIESICDQISNAGYVRYRKMFGEYVIYVDEKPVILACDNTAFVKKHPAIEHLMDNAECGFPYPSAKEHYILDETDHYLCMEVVKILAEVLPYPKSKKRKKED